MNTTRWQLLLTKVFQGLRNGHRPNQPRRRNRRSESAFTVEKLESRQLLAITGLGIAGDSLSDEYLHEDATGGGYNYAKNWVELLAQQKGVNVGSQNNANAQSGDADYRGEPRREGGYAFDWARAGATTQTLLLRGEHTGLATQITAGQVSHGVLAIGQNDFIFDSDIYSGIYNSAIPAADVQAYADTVVWNISKALTLLKSTTVKLVLSNIADYGVAPATAVAGGFTDPVKRELVTTVISAVNTRILELARDHQVPLANLFEFSKFYLGTNAAPVSTVTIGGNTIFNTATTIVDQDPHFAFVHDGIHPGTVVSTYLANLYLNAIRQGYVESSPTLFTEQEIMTAAGLPFTSNTFPVNYNTYLTLPAALSTSRIGDYVWCDYDRDGIQDDTEAFADGVEVRLFRVGVDGLVGTADDVLAGIATTNSIGRYSFQNVTSGNYFLQFVAPSPMTFTTQNQGTNDFLDSDANPVTGRTAAFTVTGGQNIMHIDAGLIPLSGAQGSLDTSFSGDGVVTNNTNAARSVAVQSDGRILVVDDANVTRYNTDGSVDTTFGTNGTVVLPMAGVSVGIQSSGKIIVAGTQLNQFAVTRLQSTGALDTTFGTSGLTLVDLPGFNFENLRQLLIRSNDTLVLGGNAVNGPFPFNRNDLGLVQLTANGLIDTSFGSAGIVTGSIGTVNEFQDMAILKDGRLIVAAGVSSFLGPVGSGGLMLLTNNGSLDTSFNATGTLMDPESMEFYSVAEQSDGKFVVGGVFGANAAFLSDARRFNLATIRRFNPNGTVDTSFGSNGAIETSFGMELGSVAKDLTIALDGKIVAAASVQVGYSNGGTAPANIGLLRLNANGTLDDSFGCGGRVVYTENNALSPAGMVLTPVGKIVVLANNGTTEHRLLRFNGNAAPNLDNSGTPYLIAPAGTNLPADMSNGILITDLLARGANADPISDTDSGALEGIALTGINKIAGTFGTWEFTLDPNPLTATWTNVETAGALSDGSALLLPADAKTRLRFVTTLIPYHGSNPAAGHLPTETKLDTGLTFRAWDRTAGIAGQRANTTTNGGTTAFSLVTETAATYFETRLWRTFNTSAQLNTYTLELEATILIASFGYEDRSTSAFSGFTILMSPIPGVPTAPLYRMYFGIAFNVDGITQTDMGYRYLTTALPEVEALESNPGARPDVRDGFYFRELGVTQGTGITGYIYTTQQPGTTVMSQIYRTDLFPKNTRTGPPGTAPTGTVNQQHGDHVYTTKTTFEMTQTPGRPHIEGGLGGWRQEAVRGFVRELSPNISGAMGQARRASALAVTAEAASTAATEFVPLPNLRDDDSLKNLASQFATSHARFTQHGRLTIAAGQASSEWVSSARLLVSRDSAAKRTSIAESLAMADGVPTSTGTIDRAAVDQVWSEVGSTLGRGRNLPWDDE